MRWATPDRRNGLQPLGPWPCPAGRLHRRTGQGGALNSSQPARLSDALARTLVSELDTTPVVDEDANGARPPPPSRMKDLSEFLAPLL